MSFSFVNVIFSLPASACLEHSEKEMYHFWMQLNVYLVLDRSDGILTDIRIEKNPPCFLIYKHVKINRVGLK